MAGGCRLSGSATQAAPLTGGYQGPAQATHPASLASVVTPTVANSTATNVEAPPAAVATPAATQVLPPTGGYQGPSPEWCSRLARTPSDQAAHDYYCH